MTTSGLPAELTREQLYDLVWSEPMLRVAERFGVSSSYMARVCSMLDIPRPERGYWAMLAAGKKKPKPSLPELPIGYSSSLSLSGHEIKVTKSLPRPQVRRRKPKKGVGYIRPSQHPLLVGAKEHFSAGRLSYEGEYLKPSKRLLVDLVVSKTGLDKALVFANELFLELEERGHRVVFRPDRENLHRAAVDERLVPTKRQGYFTNNMWSPSRCTVVYIGTLAIGLTIIEMSEEVAVRYVNGEYIREENYIPPKRNIYTFKTNKELPTGRLRLQAYSPYSTAEWVTCWEETKTVPLTNRIAAIAKKLERDAVEIAKLVEEGERRAELQRQEFARQQEQWRREEAERRVIRVRKESLDDLNRVIEKWSEVTRVEKFFEAAEQSAANLPSEERGRLLHRLKLARDLIGSTSALEHFLVWKSPDER